MDLVPPIQTDEQPKASSGTEGMPVDPIVESLGACQHAGEPIATVGGLGGSKQLLSMANESATASSTTGGTTGSSRVEAVVTSVTSESGAENLAVPKEQTALPEASEGMVGHAIRAPSP